MFPNKLLHPKIIPVCIGFGKPRFPLRENWSKWISLEAAKPKMIYLLIDLFFLFTIIIGPFFLERENEKNNQQDIFDFFFKQIELNCRELGYGDTTVNKKMKVLIRLFYEILIFDCELNKSPNIFYNMK